MKKKRSSPRTHKVRQTERLEVPTFQPDTVKPHAEQTPKTPEDAANEEAIRRMIEAAYT